MKTLFDTSNIGNMNLKNRFVRSATYENLADGTGHMTEELFEIYEDLAKGGVGTIITSYSFVTKDEQPNPGMMGIYDDSFIDEYKKLTNMIHKYNSNIIIQIVYGGSQTAFNLGERKIWGPSTVENIASKVTPIEITKEEIKSLIESFSAASVRAKEAGFDGVQIHGAHGYLFSQFLCPYYNRRQDEYGGSIENRARIIFETYEAIRNKVGSDYPILIKINCEDFMEQGLTLEECKFVCKKLSDMGIDAIEISGGSGSSRKNEGAIRTKISSPDTESYFRNQAAEIAKEISTPVILVGGHKSLEVMNEILNNTEIEYLSLSRPLLREPDLVNRWKDANKEKARCISCGKCFSVDKKPCIFL